MVAFRDLLSCKSRCKEVKVKNLDSIMAEVDL